MTEFSLKTLTTSQLFCCFADMLDELKARKVIRTRNNPVADYAEWLVAQKLGVLLEHNSKRGYDAVDNKNHICYQIKSRRLDLTNKSRQLSTIRNLKNAEFDYLIGILFNRDFTLKEAYKIPHGVIEAYKIPHGIIEKHSRYSKHVNGYIVSLRGDILTAPGVENITYLFS